MTSPSDMTVSDSATRRRGRPARAAARNGTGHVQSLSRALSLLESISRAPGGVALSDLAQRVGLAASTTHRLLSTLEQHGFAALDADRGLWTIGVKAFTVASAFLATRDLVGMARPHMHRLMERSGESVNLAILDQDQVVFLSQVECREMMRMMVALGGRAPIHASGAGKALLATLSVDDFERLIARTGLARLTGNTIERPAMLREDMLRIRARGFALDNEEHAVGLRCVAATVHDEHADAVAAVSLSGPRARITDDRIDTLGALVVATADAVTAAFGGVLPRWRSAPGEDRQ